GAANRNGGADEGHRATTQTDEPTVSDDRGRMDESCGKGERNDAEIDDEKGVIAIHPCKENVTDPGEQCSGEHEWLGAVTVDQIADKWRGKRAFGAGQEKSKEGGRQC